MPKKSLKNTEDQMQELKQAIEDTLKKLETFPEEEKKKRLVLMKKILDAYNKQLSKLRRSVEKVVQKKSAIKDAEQIEVLQKKIKNI